ncbi:MAG: twin-arginine translocase subunit TatC [Candidatus Omnitrophota bacterium]
MDKFTFLRRYLQKLHSHIIISLVAFFISSIISYFFVPRAVSILTRGVGKVVLLNPAEGFFVYLKVTLFLGLCFSIPIILYQLYKFIVINFEEKNKKLFLNFFYISCFLFILGICFTYFLLLPQAIRFFLNFSSISIIPVFSLDQYISFIFILFFMGIIIFELPYVILFLTKLEIIHLDSLKKNFKYVILISFIIAAIITPVISFFNLCTLAFPLILLYLFSIWFSQKLYKK